MKKGYLIALIFLAMLTMCSLTLNGVVIVGLLRAQRIALEAQQTALNTVSDARAIVTGASDDTFSYTLTVEQEIPIATTIPFNEDVSVPIHTTIPISTTVVIPINAGLLGTFSIDVPIRAVIPVDLEFTVPVSQTVDIATTVPLAMDVPINIPLAETSLIDYIDEVDAALARFEETLARLEGKLINPFSSDEE